jgi:acyl carrier protein
MLSTVTSTSVEDVAKALGTPPWYQFYMPLTWEDSEKLVRRVEAAGCPVLVWTIDLLAGRNAETMMRLARTDTRDCLSCHTSSPLAGDAKMYRGKPMFAGLSGEMNPPEATWAYLDRLRKMTKLKLVLKGIDTAEDARLAREHGVDAVVVSNHGGRATETGRATIDILQVKIRGHRVELGEIEAVLENHRSVKEAVVTVNNELLIAQVVREPGVNLTVSELRAFVQEQLPQAMYPAMYLFLPGLPRTAGGMRLPPYDPARPELDTPFEAPHDGTETGVAEIWAEALRIRHIGIHDNFLDLGGDSLAAIRVIVQLEQRFGFQLAMDVLFERTIASIASDIRGWRSHSSTG